MNRKATRRAETRDGFHHYDREIRPIAGLTQVNQFILGQPAGIARAGVGWL
ncbi:MAG: hypothetical protein ACRER2_05625 [Methylococcales bacterium]